MTAPLVQIPERMTWTASSLRMFRQCPRKFFWKYMMRLRLGAKDEVRDGSLVIGGMFHHCLAKWYTHRRSSMHKIVAPFQTRLDQLLEKGALQCRDQKEYDKIESTVHTFTGMMLGYEHLYQKDRDEWEVPRNQVEMTFKVDCGNFDFMGKIDLIPSKAKLTGKRRHSFITEHKSASRVSANAAYLDRLTLDTQVRSYIFGARNDPNINLPNLNQVLYDVVMKSMLRKKKTEDQAQFCKRITQDYIDRQEHYFHREPLEFPDSAIDEFELEMRQTHADYQRIVWPLANASKNKQLRSKRDFVKLLSDSGMMPELGIEPSNPRAWRPDDSTCNDYFRLCEYYPCCTEGLTPATSRQYSIRDALHEELEAEA